MWKEASPYAKTLQIATIGEDPQKVLVGVKYFPVHKLSLLCLEEHKAIAEKTSISIKRALDIPVDIYSVNGDLIERSLVTVLNILERDREKFEDIIVNVSGGDRLLSCALISAVFINGLKAFHVLNGVPAMLPVLKLGYREMISKSKLHILKSIHEAGERIGNLRELSRITGYGKPLLSYHLNGSVDSKGLIELGLVKVEKGKRGGSKISLTTLGKLLLLSS